MSKKKPVPKTGKPSIADEQLKKKIAAMEKLMSDIRKDIGKPPNLPGDWSKNK